MHYINLSNFRRCIKPFLVYVCLLRAKLYEVNEESEDTHIIYRKINKMF